jgi:hypothetical protein
MRSFLLWVQSWSVWNLLRTGIPTTERWPYTNINSYARQGPYTDTVQDEVDIVLSLDKKQLRAEVFRLREQNRSLNEQFHGAYEQYQRLFDLYNKLVEREASRLDVFVEGLRPKQVEPRETGPRDKPVRTIREPWAKVAARQEAKHTLEYWEKKQASLETEIKDLEANIDARRSRTEPN